jgi:predicted nucleotide-binding protein
VSSSSGRSDEDERAVRAVRGGEQLAPDHAAELRRRKLALSLELQSVEFEIENAELKMRLASTGNELRAALDQNGALQDELNRLTEEIRQLMPSDASELPPVIFIVHGQNEAYKEAVARLIERSITGATVTILHEQPNQGRAIIEKFEHHAAATSYAVVIMSGDDQGGRSTEAQLHARARQNVVLELGYFIAKLGRERVAVLHEESVEVPSDIHGVGYTALDAAGAWRSKLAHELAAAGLPVDFKRVR